MKTKLFLMPILGMFFISLASATIIVIPPPSPPSGLTATAYGSGGTIPTGNYAFRIVHLGNESNNNRYGAQLRSPSSNEVNITIIEGQKIYLTWTNSTDRWVSKTYLYVRNTNNSVNQWYLFLANDYNSVIGQSYNMTNWTGMYSGYAPDIWMTDGNSPNPPVPYGLNYTNGIGMVSITGNAGSLTFLDIVNAIKSYYGGTLPNTTYYNNFYNFAGTWGIKTTGAYAGSSLDITGWNLWLAGGYEGGTNLTLKASSTVYQPTILQSPLYSGSATYLYYGSSTLNNTIVSSGAYGMDTNYYGAMQTQPIQSSTLENSVEESDYPKLYFNSTYKNTKFICTQMLVYLGNTYNQSVKDLYFITGSPRFQNLYKDIYFERMVSEATLGNINAYYSTGSGYEQYSPYFIDSKFPNQPTGVPSVYFVTTAKPKNGVFLGNSYQLKVTDNDGNSISGANVLVYNRNGLIINTTTDANGEITKQIILTLRINRTSAGNGYADQWEYYYPYNFSITKSGYSSYELNNTNVSEALDWTIALQDTSEGSNGETTVIIASNKLDEDNSYPYLNYKISPFESSKDFPIKPYIIKQNEN